MPNELILLIQTIFVVSSTLAALRLGKSALIACITLQCVLANLFVLKQTTIFGLSATCADAFTIGATLGLNLLQEYFDRESAQKTIFINFGALMFYAIITQIHLLYTPAATDFMHPHFAILLTPMPRILIASLIAFFVSQHVDYYLYGLLRRIWTRNYLVARNYASIAISQLVDTIVFTFLGLFGILANLWHIVLISYAIKLLAIAIGTPLVGFSRYFMKKEQ